MGVKRSTKTKTKEAKEKKEREKNEHVVDGFISAMETMLAATLRACQHTHTRSLLVCVCANIVNCLDAAAAAAKQLNKNNLHNMSTKNAYTPRYHQ